MNSKNIAFVYDFDGTLTPEDSFSAAILPELNISRFDFWDEVDRINNHKQVDPHGAGMLYLKQMMDKCNIPLTRHWLASKADKINFCSGLEDEWFTHMNAYATSLDLKAHHYIISAGQKELIDACKIAHQFEGIYANEYYYDNNDHALWPAHIVNSTNKLQFLFRIHKGLFDLGNYLELYEYVPKVERAIPFENIIFIGDGETDVPCMKVTKGRGGLAVSVYPNEDYRGVAQRLHAQNRVDACFEANYKKNSPLSQYIIKHLQHIAQKHPLHESSLK
ncbi:MAG: haloacid dehalogenase-like hydrolase [Alphaproteobacteria bacterium]